MKKVTISAAVLALAMMGCSDAGLDNSVASTNEVKKEAQDQNFLAKMEPQPLMHGIDGMVDYYYDNGLAIRVHSYVHPTSPKGVGAFWKMSGPTPDVTNILTVAVAGCGIKANNQFKCDHHRAHHESGYPNGPIFSNDMKSSTTYLDVPRETIGVVAAFGAVWNSGTPNEDIFNAASYSGALDYGSALQVYYKYLLQAHNNLLNNRCIDYVPNETNCNY